MAKQLRIYTIEDEKEGKFLREKSLSVSNDEIESEKFRNFLKDLLHTAKNSEEQIGIPARGIAAPQTGEHKRVFYILKESINKWQVYINPEIKPLNFSKITTTEGCLSVPNVEEDVMRYRRIEVKYQDLDGKLRKEKLYDNDAVAVQHELDHLEGILFIDRIG